MYSVCVQIFSQAHSVSFPGSELRIVGFYHRASSIKNDVLLTIRVHIIMRIERIK